MLFQELRELKKLVDQYNQKVVGKKAEFFNPHMFRDGRWSVAIIFSENPDLADMWAIVDNCFYHIHNAFWGVINGKITLFVQ